MDVCSTHHMLVEPGMSSYQNWVSSFIKNSSFEALMIILGMVYLSLNTEKGSYRLVCATVLCGIYIYYHQLTNVSIILTM